MAEYIDREELMKFPIRRDHYDKEHGNEHFIYGIETVLEYAENLPAADVAPVVWIPVTDRLPEAGTRSNGWGDVTVIATNGKFVRPLIYERAIVRGKVVWRWKWPWDRIYDGNPVTHWMPLPEPPKGVSDNG